MPEARHHAQQASAWTGRINSLVFYALLMLVLLAPIPLGSNRAWAWSLCSFLVGLLALAWCINAIVSRQRVSLSLPLPIIALFLASCLWALLQASTWLTESLAHPLWAFTSEAAGLTATPVISLNPGDTLTAVMRLAAYGLVFFLVFARGEKIFD